MPSQAELFFSRLCVRALATAKSPPELAGVESLGARGWLLSFRVGDHLVDVAATIESSESTLVYCYRTPVAPDALLARRLATAGRLLCLALARVEPGPLPALEDPPDPPRPEVLSFTLRGDCDRGCVFCVRTVDRRTPAHGHLRRLSVLDVERGVDSLAHIEATLRERAGQSHELVVAFGGSDCFASPDFDAALGLAHELGYRTNVHGPGTRLCEPGFVELLRDRGVARVGLTAHAADEPVFDRVAGKPGAYRLFWDALERLLGAGIDVDVSVPLIAATVNDLPRHLARLCELPCGIDVFYWYPDGPGLEAKFTSIGVSFELAIAALERAAGCVPPRRINVNGIPRCMASNQLLTHFAWAYLAHLVDYEFVRVETCSSCERAPLCPGVVPIYPEQRGWPASAVPLGARRRR